MPRWLESPRALYLALAASALLALPGSFFGFFADDYVHQSILEGFDEAPG